MPTDKAKYSVETQAVKLASKDIKDTMQGFKDEGKIPFMKTKQGKSTQRMYEAIQASAMATKLLDEGYPAAMAYRVAQLERQKFAEQGMTSEGLAIQQAQKGAGSG